MNQATMLHYVSLDASARAVLARAIEFAIEAHRGQERKNGTGEPYVMHPYRVMFALLEAGVCDAEVLAAALLHDTVEDTAVTLEQLRGEFGERVAGIVAGASDDKALPKAERKRLQVEHAAHQREAGARWVKLADKWDNCSDLQVHPPRGWSRARVQGYLVWAHAVVTALARPPEDPSSTPEERAFQAKTRDMIRAAIDLFAPPGQEGRGETRDLGDLLAAYYEEMSVAND